MLVMECAVWKLKFVDPVLFFRDILIVFPSDINYKRKCDSSTFLSGFFLAPLEAVPHLTPGGEMQLDSLSQALWTSVHCNSVNLNTCHSGLSFLILILRKLVLDDLQSSFHFRIL